MTNRPPLYRTTEWLLREMRQRLAFAHEQELAGDSELADAAGAVAANKLASAIRVDERTS